MINRIGLVIFAHLSYAITKRRMQMRNMHRSEKLFNRLPKASVSDEFIGMWLAVVRKICTLYRFGIEYTYADGLHIVTVCFV